MGKTRRLKQFLTKEYIVLLLSAIVVSCTSSQTDKNNEVPTFKVEEIKKGNEQLLNLLSFSHIIPIKNDSIILNSYNKIEIQNSLIYILDKKQNILLSIDMGGKTLTLLNKRGNGPDEYIAINDFAINKDGVFATTITSSNIVKGILPLTLINISMSIHSSMN